MNEEKTERMISEEEKEKRANKGKIEGKRGGKIRWRHEQSKDDHQAIKLDGIEVDKTNDENALI